MSQAILKNISNPRVREKYQKYFQLPKSIRSQFFNSQTAAKIRQAGKKNNLNLSQISEAAYLTGGILLGEFRITEFVERLMQDCQLNQQEARQLARDINQVIFLPVKDDLKRLHQINYWPRENEVSASIQKEEYKFPRLNGNLVNLRKKE